jgi:hypothetical protein
VGAIVSSYQWTEEKGQVDRLAMPSKISPGTVALELPSSTATALKFMPECLMVCGVPEQQ